MFARALHERVLCWLLEKCTAKWWLPGRARAPHAIFSLRCHRPEESRKGVSNEETGQTGKGLTIAGHSKLDTRRPQMVGFREVCAPGCMYGGFFSISFCFCLFVCLLVFFFCLYIYIYIPFACAFSLLSVAFAAVRRICSHFWNDPNRIELGRRKGGRENGKKNSKRSR